MTRPDDEHPSWWLRLLGAALMALMLLAISAPAILTVLQAMREGAP